MPEETTKPEEATKIQPEPYRIRLPGFLVQEDIGLGDAIRHATYALRVRPCGGCQRRAAVLNRWVHLTGRPRQ